MGQQLSLQRTVGLGRFPWLARAVLLASCWMLIGQKVPAVTAVPASRVASFPGVSSPEQQLQAIVRLRDWRLPPPTAHGSAVVPLDPLDTQGKLWVLSLQVGERSERFLLDTGASTSLITPALAEHLGSRGQVVPPEQLELAMAGDRCPPLQARLHRLPRLRVGLAEAQGLTALALAGSLIPPGVAGILGWDFLGRYRWQLDPQQRLLSLQAQQPRAWHPPQGAIALIPRAGVYLAPVTIAGQGPFMMLLDTGAESTFISQRVAAQVRLGAPQQPVTVLGFCGQESATLATLASLQLGQHRIQDLEAVVLGESAILQSLNVDGILGQNVLNRFVQTWAAGGNLDQRPVLGLQPFSRQP